MFRRLSLAVYCGLLVSCGAIALAEERGWVRHTIDRGSRGADGVRLGDLNGDGLLDVVTAWEEGGEIRVAINPGAERVREPWLTAVVGRVESPEDAVLVDVDGDGVLDVVTSCEGKTRTAYVHWAPSDRARVLDETAWRTEPLPATAGKQMWMYCLPLQVDNRHGIDLVLGSKGPGASIGWLAAPANARTMADWRWHPIYEAGWIMSLVAEDVDGDGHVDIVASDRRGTRRGVFWLENPGPQKAAGPWREHRVGPLTREVMFLDVVDFNGDGLRDIVAMSIADGLVFYERQPGAKAVEGVRPAPAWQEFVVAHPVNTGRGKSVRIADVNLDGQLDAVVSCETSNPPKAGVVWMSYRESLRDPVWQTHPLSDPEGVKFDLVELIDLDGDGDLDAIACEESTNLGVVWYENPTR